MSNPIRIISFNLPNGTLVGINLNNVLKVEARFKPVMSIKVYYVGGEIDTYYEADAEAANYALTPFFMESLS